MGEHAIIEQAIYGHATKEPG